MYRGPCSLLAQPFVLALVSSISQLHPPSALIWLCFCDREAKFVPTCVAVLQAQPYLNHGEHMHKVWLLCPRAVVPNPGAPHPPTYRFGRPSGDFCRATSANYTHLHTLDFSSDSVSRSSLSMQWLPHLNMTNADQLRI